MARSWSAAHLRSFVRTRIGALSLLMVLATPAVIAAVKLDDPDVMLYPLASVVYDEEVVITGLARPHQRVDIDINGTLVGQTTSNESGDFVATVRPLAALNEIRASMPQGMFASSSHPQRFRFQLDALATKPRSQKSGREASPTARVSPMVAPAAPVLTAPAATATTNPITVGGTAAASSLISFYVNGRFTRSMTASGTGAFSTWVPLEDGSNAIYVTATNGQGETSVASNSVSTSYTNTLTRTQGGTIAQDTVWTKGDGTAYSITSNLTISPGATLWIQPGALVNVAGSFKISSQGAFRVAGTSTSLAILKATNASCTATARRSDWLGIEVAPGGTADLDYAQVQCASTGIDYLAGSLGGSVKHSQIINNSRGVRMQGATATALVSPAINSGNTFNNNLYAIFPLKNSRPVISGGNTFSANDYGIYIQGISDATQDPQPTINGNQILRSNGFGILTNSFAATPTTTLNARGNWWETTDQGVIATEVYDINDATGLPIVDFSGYLGASGGSAFFTGTTLLGTISANTTLPTGETQTLGNITVNAGATLTVPAGSLLNLATGAKLLIKGALNVEGTSASRATFKPSTPACNGVATDRTDWAGIEIAIGGTLNMNFADVLCASRGVYFNSGTGLVKNSRFINNRYGLEMIAISPARTTPSITTSNEVRGASEGIVVRQNTSPTITGNQLTSNGDAIWIVGNGTAAQNPAPIINANSFQLSGRNIYADNFGSPRLSRIDATGNWWGTADPSAIIISIRDWTDATTEAPIVDFAGFLTAAGGVSAWPGPTLNGPILANRTLPNVEHLMLGRVEIDAGITVAVTAGAKITVPANLPMIVSGILNVNGTSAARAVFKPLIPTCTETSSSRLDWLGISFLNGASGTVNFADIYCANIGISLANSSVVKNSRFYGNEQGMLIKGTSTTALASPLVQTNEVRGSTDGIYIDVYSSPTINAGNLITANATGIELYGNDLVARRPNAVINANTILNNTNFDVYAAHFAPEGSTEIVNARGNWWGTPDPAAISAKIYDNSESSLAPIVDFSGYLASQGGTAVFNGTTLAGHIASNRALTAGIYQVLGSLTVDAGVSLTISPGAQINLLPARSFKVLGNLIAQGTSSQRVVFTSLATYPAKGDWKGIQVLTGGNILLEHARVEYSTNGIQFTGGQGSVKETLSWFNTYGVLVGAKSNPTISPNNEITKNDYGVWVEGDSSSAANNPLPVTTNNNIYGNISNNFGARYFVTPASVVLNATSNWWGTTDTAAIRATIYTGSTSSPTVDIGTPLSASTGPLAIQLSSVSTTIRKVQPLDASAPAVGVFTISRAGSVKTEFRRQTDNVAVYSYTQSFGGAGTYGFSWNGKTQPTGGEIVPGGMYRAVVTASDGRDSLTIDPKPVPGTNTTTGNASATYKPFQNEFYKGTVSLVQPGLVSLKVVPEGSVEFYAWQDVYFPSGTSWVYWDGRDPSGNVVTVPVSILVTDSAAVVPTAIQVLTTKPTISGILAAPDVEVKADPYIVTHSYEQITRMAYRISADSYVRFVLLPPGDVDIHGSSAIVLIDNQLQSAKDGQGAPLDHVVEWRGYDTAVPSHILVGTEGPYTFAIEAKEASTSQSTVYRGTLNIRQ